jgi:hypothetical protein
MVVNLTKNEKMRNSTKAGTATGRRAGAVLKLGAYQHARRMLRAGRLRDAYVIIQRTTGESPPRRAVFRKWQQTRSKIHITF